MKHWPILIIFGMKHHEKTFDVSDYNSAHLTVILLLDYLEKCRSGSVDPVTAAALQQ